MIFTMNVKDKNTKVVTETGAEPAVAWVVVNRPNQLDHRCNWAQGLLTLYPTWPPFSREHDRNPLPFRVPLMLSMFFWSLNLAYSALRLSTRAFFKSMISLSEAKPCILNNEDRDERRLMKSCEVSKQWIKAQSNDTNLTWISELRYSALILRTNQRTS